MAYQPVAERVFLALLDRLTQQLPTLCAQAEVPAPQILSRAGLKIVADTVYVSYTGSRISARANKWVDFTLQFDCEVYTFHPDPQFLVQKALRYEWAVRNAIESDRTLGGVVEKCLCSDAEGDVLSELTTQPLVHGMVIRITAQVRVPQPEEAA